MMYEHTSIGAVRPTLTPAQSAHIRRLLIINAALMRYAADTLNEGDSGPGTRLLAEALHAADAETRDSLPSLRELEANTQDS